MTNPNQELLSWAVENIKEWHNAYTHLRSDSSVCSPSVFYTYADGWGILPSSPIWMDKPGYLAWEAVAKNGCYSKDFSTDTPQVITKEEWSNGILLWQDGIAAKNAPTSSPEAQQGHVHAELMAEYALVAKTNPEPWKEFEYFGKYGWEPCLADLCFRAELQYRRKPTPSKTMNIGGIIVEAWPLEKASEVNVSRYYMPAIDCGGGFTVQDAEWYSDRYDISALENNIVFSTKEQAQAVADALNLVYNRALGNPEA